MTTLAEASPSGSEFWLGARRTFPLAVSVVPFAIATGLAATEAGLSSLQAVVMSVVVFAGAAQLAALELIGSGAPVAAAVAVGVVINLRFALYGASLSGFFRHLPRPRRAAMAYLLTDQAYATSMQRFHEPGGRRQAPSFFVGAGLLLWLAWQLGTLVGATVGMQAPDFLELEFAVPLAFVALAIPALRDRTDAAVAAAAVVALFVLASLPLGLNLLVAVVVGLVTGAVAGGVRR